VEVLSENQETS